MRELMNGYCGGGRSLDLFVWQIEKEARQNHFEYETSYDSETKTYTLKIKEKE